ncbi:MAG: response regulator [Rhodocyclaceae bacterium]|nr:MAG: response regulator [Rhodocyclaceae bacterium]
MRVLVVDDSEGLRKVLAALLISAGHETVASLADGNGVEEIVQRERPDFVFLDYQLPGRDGLEILASIQALAPEVDVLFMTASTEEQIEQRAADAGAAGFIRKPFSQAQIIDELREVTETRRVATQAGIAADAGEVPDEATTEAAAGSAAKAAAETADPATSPERPGSAKRTAVIADDSSSVRMVLKGLLEESGIRVVQAVGNGAEALNALRAHRPGLLCLDVNMPVMSGLEALEAARQMCPETAVVMVTGCADRAFVTQAASLGAKGYILKPLRPAYVQNFVRKLFP